MSSVSVDTHGFLRGFPYHDGALEGVLVSAGSAPQIHLAIRSADGEPRVLTLHGVAAFLLDGFREGNIILHIRVLNAGTAEESPAVRAWEAGRRALSLDPDAVVFVLESSYGATILAVCRDVDVSPAGGTLVPSVPHA